MSFLHPWAIWIGVVAAAAPVAVHLLTRPRPVRMPLSTLRFVREAVHQRRARHRLRDVLILTCRTAAVLLMALTVARPQWGQRPLVSDAQSGDAVRVVILDVSQSTAALDGGIAAIERARTAAADYLRYRPGLQANLILAGADARAVFDGPSANFDALRDELAACAALPQGLKAERAIGLAARLLALESEEDQRGRELVVVSDFQRSSWGGADFAPLPEGTQIQFHSVAPAEQPPNLAICRAEARPAGAGGGSVQLEIDVANYTPAVQQVEVEVALGDVTRRLKATIPAGTVKTLSEELALRQTGWQWGEARLVGLDDALAADNRRPLVVCLRPELVYALLTRQPAGRRPVSSHYLEYALAPDPRPQPGAARVIRVDPSAVDAAALAPADLILLEHPGKLSEDAVRLLAGLLRRGRPMLYFAAEAIDATNLKRLSDAFGGGLQMPVEFLPPPAGQLRRNLALASVRREEPPFAVFGDGLPAVLKEFRFAGGLNSRRLDRALDDMLLATLSDGSAGIVLASADAGTLAVVNADLGASNLRDAEAFLPLLQELIQRMLDRGHVRGVAACGETLVVQLPTEAGLAAGLARMAVTHAAEVACRAPAGKAVPGTPLGHSLGAALAVAAVVALLTVCLPGLAQTEWDRFLNPQDDVPPYSELQFEVTQDKAEVLYGEPLTISATVSGGAVERLELVLAEDDGRQETLPMFCESDGSWRATLGRVTASADYHVRAYRARSKSYRITVIMVPRIESVRLKIAPPEHANRPAYEGPLPRDGVAGYAGTQVQVWAASNRPLSGGRLVVTHAAGKSPGAKPSEAEVALSPAAPGSEEVCGEFAVTADGRFELSVTDEDGVESLQKFSGAIALLPDERPFIRLLQPKPTSLATPDALLPVLVAAEDDCGISRVQLFRSLNDSRPLPADLRIPAKPPRRFNDKIYLPLGDYGLEPGDVLKLFGRVEDNDPAGAKGSESTVVTVQIISQEEFERMQRVREGIEVLTSKYREAQRRLESLAAEMEKLQKKLQEQPKDSPVAQETKHELQRLSKQLRQEAGELRRLAGRKLPFDLDGQISPQLEHAAKVPDELADELEKLAEEAGLNGEALARQLSKLHKRLATERDDFEKAAMLPLDLLTAVFPLVADQSRFTMLVLRQRDLAERLAALKGRDREDDPALKTRMRDLEQEQRQIREALSELLDDIEDHVKKLPEDEKFNKLRETAGQFVQAVRTSGATEAMAAAETGLAEFSGTRGYEQAKEAADILGKFLKDCEGMGNCAGGCLIFQPGLGNCLGNTAAQLLAAMGLGTGSGYGGAGAGGGSEGAIPIRYRRQVGKYFQRIAEELGEK